MRSYSRSEEHVGEWRLTLRADSLEDLFVEAARVIAREGGRSRPRPHGAWEAIALTSRDVETLLVDWMNELLGRSEVNRRAYDEVRSLGISGGELTAEVRGRPVAVWRSPLKAATYHGIELSQQDARWRATVVLDV